MEPKFQSNFIPKHPASAVGLVPQKPVKHRSIFGLVANFIFIISVLAALSAFGYKIYLDRAIAQMDQQIEDVRQSLNLEGAEEIVRLDDRIVYTGSLVRSHTIATPFFRFLSANTVSTIQFTDLLFQKTSRGANITMSGVAQGYADLAFQADVFSDSEVLSNPTFSGLALDSEGNVQFTLTASLDSSFLLYDNQFIEEEVEEVVEEAIIDDTSELSELDEIEGELEGIDLLEDN